MKADSIRITPEWNRSREQIWAEKFATLEDTPVLKIVPLHKKIIVYAAAAVVALILALPTMAFFYTKDVVSPRGQHVSAVLPDGSKVELNAESSLSYKPYWWRFNRSVKMNGEAYFEVSKGKKFSVHSPSGVVAVLGTSFNVLDRSGKYNVTCLTGKVSVESNNHTLLLEPGTAAKLEENRLMFSKVNDVSERIGWISGRFSFAATPLKEVIEEVERQYNIKVKYSDKNNYLYTGNFSKGKSPEQVLEIIGKPFGIKLSIEK